jgi:hypothetical protein
VKPENEEPGETPPLTTDAIAGRGSPQHRRGGLASMLVLGAVCGFAWAAGFRGMMSEIAGGAALELARSGGRLFRCRRHGYRCALASTRKASDGLRLGVPVGDRASRERIAARRAVVGAAELQ